MPDLTLRPTVIGGDVITNDYQVIHDGRPIGRIRQAEERIGHSPGWDWTINVPLPIPTWAHGSAGGFEEAKTAFRDAWERFHTKLTPESIAHWHHHQDAAADRTKPR